MTNTALQAMKAEFGDRICAFLHGISDATYFGYKGSNSPSIDDVTFESKGGIDFVVIPAVDVVRQQLEFEADIPDKDGKLQKVKKMANIGPITYKNYIETSSIYRVIVVDEDFVKVRPSIETF